MKPCSAADEPAALHTRTKDVEINVDGYVTHDRAIGKMDFAEMRKMHMELQG